MRKWDPLVGEVRLRFDAVLADTGTPDPPLSDNIVMALKDARNITMLYTHQASAISALFQGKDVIVSTSTASGKSVIYQVQCPSCCLYARANYNLRSIKGPAIADA
jgi:superfamily II DNA/RNA helicase